jgi:hypothetical protein
VVGVVGAGGLGIEVEVWGTFGESVGDGIVFDAVEQLARSKAMLSAAVSLIGRLKESPSK